MISDINSPHTQKWAISLKMKGIDIAVFSIATPTQHWYLDFSIPLYSPMKFDHKIFSASLFSKIAYLRAFPYLKKVIKEFKPDIVDAHYASSNGLLGALTGFKPLIISVWGSDIYSFPKKSFIGKYILRFNFKQSALICSTSMAMVSHIKNYTDHNIKVIYFGVDPNIFKPVPVASPFQQDDFVIGTIKSLEPVYGIDILIKVFYELCLKYPEQKLKLLIVGGGSLATELKSLVLTLGLIDKVVFTGQVPYSEIVQYYNMLSLYIALSHSEGFGVAVLEASACEIPVVVSDAGGLPEVVDDDKTGTIVPVNDIHKAVEAVERLIFNEPLRREMGKAGREKMISLFNWDKNVDEKLKLYRSLLIPDMETEYNQRENIPAKSVPLITKYP
jgi:glycosyltransferase involved in cell wall biosynthesis